MPNYTPQQIEQFLRDFFDVVGTRQYVGMRYVPIFGRRGESSIDWDNSAPYEPLTIVLYQGTSYTSRTFVPEGIDITNETYWAKTGDYDAQVEAYRREVIQLQEDWVDWKTDTEGDLSDWKQDTTDDLNDWKDDTVDAFTAAIDNLPGIIPSSEFSDSLTVKDYIDRRSGFAGANCLCITDSWGSENVYGVTTNWMRMVCNALHMNYIDLHQGSTGFMRPPTFLTRAQNYAAANPDMVPKINYILISGSTNDATYNNTDIRNAIATTLLYLENTFTNAIIYYIPQISGADMNKCSVASTSFNTWTKAAYNSYVLWVNNYDAFKRVIFINELQYVLVGLDPATYMNSDFVHPTQLGHDIMARTFLSCVIGGGVPEKKVIKITGSNLVDNLNNTYTPASYNQYAKIYSNGDFEFNFNYRINNFTSPQNFELFRQPIPLIRAINNQSYELEYTGLFIATDYDTFNMGRYSRLEQTNVDVTVGPADPTVDSLLLAIPFGAISISATSLYISGVAKANFIFS